MALEILSRMPAAQTDRVPLLFVHGAYAGAWCWDRYFLPWFAEQGYPAYALSLRGHAGSGLEGSLDLVGIDDYVSDTVAVATQLERPPVLIGHSMGAIVAQRAARGCKAQGVVLLAPVPPQGLAASSWSIATRDPPLFFAISTIRFGGADSRELRRARHWLFSESLSEADAMRYLVRLQRESQRALLDLLWPQYFWLSSSVGIPALVLGASNDAFFTPAMTRQAADLHGVMPTMFTDMAHLMMLEPGWRDVAQHIRTWLEQNLR